MYKCPHCGGEMEFLPESGIIKCEYCGSEFRPEEEEVNKNLKSAEEHPADREEGSDQPAGKVYTCSQCGASIYTLEDTGVTFCSYCGSQAFLESKIRGDENLMPDVVIPFRISKEKCEEIYKDKIKSAWFLPRAMRSDRTIDKFRGIYMPCWIYNGKAKANGDYGGVTTTRSGSYDIIKTYKIAANIEGTYKGFVEDAAASFPDGIMKEIAPYNMDAARPFQANYLTGFYADVGNVPADAYNDKIYRTLDAAVKNDLSRQHDMVKHNVTSSDLEKNTQVQASITSVRKGFFPVWFLSNKNKRTGLMSYAVINGLTGKIHADLPVDMKKYLLLSLLIAIPVFLVLQFFTMKPTFLLIVTMILLAVLMVFASRMIGDTYVQEHDLDDIGRQYLNRAKDGNTRAEGDSHLEEKSVVSGPDPGQKARDTGMKILKGIGLAALVIAVAAIVIVTKSQTAGVIGVIGVVVLFSIISSASKNKKKASNKEFTAESRVRPPASVAIRAMIMPLVGIIVGVLVLIINPVHDAYYYGAAVLCCIMLILTVLDFVRNTNRLSLRKPAQLGKRGGDENA